MEKNLLQTDLAGAPLQKARKTTKKGDLIGEAESFYEWRPRRKAILRKLDPKITRREAFGGQAIGEREFAERFYHAPEDAPGRVKVRLRRIREFPGLLVRITLEDSLCAEGNGSILPVALERFSFDRVHQLRKNGPLLRLGKTREAR